MFCLQATKANGKKVQCKMVLLYDVLGGHILFPQGKSLKALVIYINLANQDQGLTHSPRKHN